MAAEDWAKKQGFRRVIQDKSHPAFTHVVGKDGKVYGFSAIPNASRGLRPASG